MYFITMSIFAHSFQHTILHGAKSPKNGIVRSRCTHVLAGLDLYCQDALQEVWANLQHYQQYKKVLIFPRPQQHWVSCF